MITVLQPYRRTDRRTDGLY